MRTTETYLSQVATQPIQAYPHWSVSVPPDSHEFVQCSSCCFGSSPTVHQTQPGPSATHLQPAMQTHTHTHKWLPILNPLSLLFHTHSLKLKLKLTVGSFSALAVRVFAFAASRSNLRIAVSRLSLCQQQRAHIANPCHNAHTVHTNIHTNEHTNEHTNIHTNIHTNMHTAHSHADKLTSAFFTSTSKNALRGVLNSFWTRSLNSFQEVPILNSTSPHLTR